LSKRVCVSEMCVGANFFFYLLIDKPIIGISMIDISIVDMPMIEILTRKRCGENCVIYDSQ